MKLNVYTIETHRTANEENHSTSSSISEDDNGSSITLSTTGTPASGHSQSTLVHNPKSQNISTGKTLIFLIKGNLGPGLFAIPAAFKDAGLLGGSITIPLMAILSIHCMHMLVKCTQVLKIRKGHPDMAMDYPRAIEEACLTGPPSIQKYARLARKTIKMSLFVKEVAFCAVFILFAGTYLQQLASYFSPELHWTIRHWTCVMGIIALGMSFVTHHHLLHILSYVASSIKLFSLIVLFVYVFQDLPHVSERPSFSTAAYMFLYFGTVFFAFEGVTQVLPLHNNMRTTRHFRGWNGVLNTGMILIGCLYFTLGFYGYLKYGENTYPSITMNLPKDQTICQIVKIGLIIALMINYANQLSLAVEITQPTIDKYCHTKWKRVASLFAVRSLVYLLSLAVALISENLDLFMSLAGSLTCTLLCLVFPPTLDMITFWNKLSWYRLIKNVFIILVGILGFTTGSAAAIMAFHNYFNGVVETDLRTIF